MRGKYIIFEDPNGLEYPVLLPRVEHWVNHNQIPGPGKPVAAGFFTIDGEDIFCTGKSTSLNLSNRGDVDTNLIKKFLQS